MVKLLRKTQPNSERRTPRSVMASMKTDGYALDAYIFGYWSDKQTTRRKRKQLLGTVKRIPAHLTSSIEEVRRAGLEYAKRGVG